MRSAVLVAKKFVVWWLHRSLISACVFCVISSAAVIAEASTEMEIRIPPSIDPIFFHRNAYSMALLENALTKSGIDYKLVQSDVQIGNLARLRRHIAKGIYDVSWLHTSSEIEEELLPIRIPIFKGIIGWRIAFIRPESTTEFSAVKDLQGLRVFMGVQGFNWPDVAIMEHSKLKLRVGVDLPNIRQLLVNKRADYFPRSISEIWDEEDYFSEQGAIVEQTFALYYPSAVYFFVSRENTALAEAIKSGLEISLSDGSYDQLFFRFFGESIDRANLPNRRVIYLDNPQLPKQTPLARRELWFHQHD